MLLQKKIFFVILSIFWMCTGSRGANYHRTDLFLNQDYIPDGEEMLLELRDMEKMEGMEESADDDEILMATYGNMDKNRYRQQNIFDKIPKVEGGQRQNESTASNTTKPEGVKQDEFIVFPSDAFKQAVNALPQGLQVIINSYAENFQKFISDAVHTLNDISKPPTEKRTISKERECIKNHRSKCQVWPQFSLQCMYNCLTEGDEFANSVSSLIPGILIGLCNPISNLFEAAYEKMSKDPQGSRFSTYLASVKGDTKDLRDAAEFGADSLLKYLITGVTTPYLPLGGIAEKMAEAVKYGNPETDIDSIARGWNPACHPGMLANNVYTLRRAFQKDPGLVDIALPGWALINTLVKYVPGDHQVFLSGFIDVFSAMTGISCGLVYAAKTGELLDCDEMGGFPRAGTILKSVSAHSNEEWQKYCKEPSSAAAGAAPA